MTVVNLTSNLVSLDLGVVKPSCVDPAWRRASDCAIAKREQQTNEGRVFLLNQRPLFTSPLLPLLRAIKQWLGHLQAAFISLGQLLSAVQTRKAYSHLTCSLRRGKFPYEPSEAFL